MTAAHEVEIVGDGETRVAGGYTYERVKIAGDFWVRRDVITQIALPGFSIHHETQLGIGVFNACGLACVKMFANMLGLVNAPSVAELSRQYDARQDGTNSRDLYRAAQRCGFELHVNKTTSKLIDTFPAIVLHYYRWPSNLTTYRNRDGSEFRGTHWAIISGVDANNVYYHDPLRKRNTVPPGGLAMPRLIWERSCYLPVENHYWYLTLPTQAQARINAMRTVVTMPDESPVVRAVNQQQRNY
jgi:hypothetical protein